jgi:hypothetical protein
MAWLLSGHLGESGGNASLILSSALEPSLVASVGTMTRAYGLNLLGTLEKPAAPDQLRQLLERFRGTTNRSLGQSQPAFSIESICQGIEAGEFEPYFQPRLLLQQDKFWVPRLWPVGVIPIWGLSLPTASSKRSKAPAG